MASNVIAALGIDKEDMSSRLITITEEENADANFILSCILSERLSKNSAVVLVALHNTFGHYHNVGMKLGYNLKSMQDKNSLILIEPMKSIANVYIAQPKSDSGDKNENVSFFESDKETILHQLYNEIKNSAEILLEKQNSVCIVIDDLSHLLDLNISVRDVIVFIQYCKNLLLTHTSISLVTNVHVGNEDDQIVANTLAHLSDLRVQVSGLKTGYSSEVTGIMNVEWTNDETLNSWVKQNEYHFKLHDRIIKLFAPGTVTISS